MEFRIFQPFIEGALIYGLGAIGLGITWRFLKFPDFTTFGSIIIGGVISIAVTIYTNVYVGILSSILTGAILGCITATIANSFKVSKVIAGIITFIGTSTPIYWIASDGSISLERDINRIFTSTYSLKDTLIILSIIIAIVLTIHLLMKTKIGSLIYALSANKQYVNFRHKYKFRIEVLILALGNGIVAFAGGLYALRDGAAYAISHADFLPFAFGGIFAGGVVVFYGREIISYFAKLLRLLNKKVEERIDRISDYDFGSSSNIGLTFLSYAFGAGMFFVINGLLTNDAFATQDGRFSIPYQFKHFTYLLVALAMALAVRITTLHNDIKK